MLTALTLPGRRAAPWKPRPVCRHCSRCAVARPRGLCWSCYYTPGVKERYGTPDPAKAKYARRGVGHGTGTRPLPEPTDAPAGTAAKIAVMMARAEEGVPLFHPADPKLGHEARTIAGILAVVALAAAG